MDIGNGSSVEIVDEFCYLGDMSDGDADAAMTTMIHCGWFMFRSLPKIFLVVARKSLRC